MNRLVFVLIVGIFSTAFSFAQVTLTGSDTIQTGFVVVTPQFGGGSGLNISETFGVLLNGSLVQTTILSSPLVTVTNMVIKVDTLAQVNTALAIVNPNEAAAALNLTLNDQSGTPIQIRNLTMAGTQQISRFATELFDLTGLTGPFEGMLFIRSNVPIGVTGVMFDGSSLTSLPVATQLDSNNVTTSPFSLVGPGAILLSQIATGRGWESRITIGNTASVAQIVRVDFFNPEGGRLVLPIGTSVPAVTIPAGGVVSFGTTDSFARRLP